MTATATSNPQRNKVMSSRLLPAAALPALIALLAACGASTDSGSDDAGSGSDAYPVTVQNCGEDVVFDKPPERVVLLESAPITGLEGLGVLDRVVAKAGSFPEEYYNDELAERIADIPMLADDIDASGHLAISQELVVSQEPDLVFGIPDGISRENLADSDINALVQSIYCPGKTEEASFDTLYDELQTYGKVFDRTAEADELVESLQERVEAVRDQSGSETGKSAAVLYPSVGGGPLYAYGNASMAHPQLEAAGLDNVFGDSTERVFEVNIEELVSRNPDVIILLYQGDPKGVEEELTKLPGAGDITAVQNDDILVQLFNFTEPPSPLVVDGLERIAKEFGS